MVRAFLVTAPAVPISVPNGAHLVSANGSHARGGALHALAPVAFAAQCSKARGRVPCRTPRYRLHHGTVCCGTAWFVGG